MTADKCRVLDEIASASPDRLRASLTKLLCHYNAHAVWAEIHFSELSPRQLAEGCVALEVCELLAGGLSPCAQPGCDRASFFCKIHNRESPMRKPVKVPVQVSVRMCHCLGAGCASCR